MPRRELVVLAMLAAVCCACPLITDGKSFNTSPRPGVLLESGKRVVVQDALDGVALYDRTGTARHRFTADGASVTAIAVTPDEAFLLIAGDDGSLRMGDLRNGAVVWTKTGMETGLGFVYDASFAWGGSSVVVCGLSDGALVYDTATGAPRGHGRFRPDGGMPFSAALSPDGSTGALVEAGTPGRVFTFDVASGRTTDTGLTGMWPIRISSDGRYLAFRNTELGAGQRLDVAPLFDPTPTNFTRVGRFRYFEHVRPTADGRFNITARSTHGQRSTSMVMGAVCDPATGELRNVWGIVPGSDDLLRTDFDAGAMVGVSTTFNLKTTVTDLTNGGPRLIIDRTQAYAAARGAAEADLAAADRVVTRPGPAWMLGTAGALLGMLFAGTALFVRRIKATTPR
jgi:hypothetical protein